MGLWKAGRRMHSCAIQTNNHQTDADRGTEIQSLSTEAKPAKIKEKSGDICTPTEAHWPCCTSLQ